MPRIFIDHQKFSTQKYGGISRYFGGIVNSIEANSEFDVLLGVLLSSNEYIKKRRLNSQWLNTLLSSKYNSKIYSLNQRYCQFLLSQNHFDLFHPTYYDPYYLPLLKKPLIITVHDMTHERLPEYFWAEDPLTRNKRLNIERADKIIAISETTKRDLIEYSNVEPSKIEVIYHGIESHKPIKTQVVDDLPESYILYVGDRSGFKNFYLFARAFKSISLRFPEVKMVLSGGGSLACAEKEFLKAIGLTDKVRHFHVNDHELNFLYQNALAFVYPSLHEGFGLPILEAFYAGCPLVLADNPCFKEIADQAAIYFERNSVESLVLALETIMCSSSNRKSLITSGFERVKRFPMSYTVEATLSLYRSLI